MSFIVYAQVTPTPRHFAPDIHVCSNVAAARAAGHTIIEHPNGEKYEEVVIAETLIRETHIGPVSVRNHSSQELHIIINVIKRLPEAVLHRFAEQYNGIVCVDWTGNDWREPGVHPQPLTRLSGGTNMRYPRTRNGITESGTRIELTHSAMYELRGSPYGRRGIFTLWHELGHMAYRNGFTPRTVSRSDYGRSVHVGAEEQPAYAFMWYFLNPRRLAPADRIAFDRIFGDTRTVATHSGLIRQSVGRAGRNNNRDVRVIQKLLNRHTPLSMTHLVIDGICNDVMIDRIRWFQQNRMRVGGPDGRVIPNGRTIRALQGEPLQGR